MTDRMADQEVIIPEDLDLLYYTEGGRRRTAAMLGGRQIGPFPSEGAFKLIAAELARADPDKYGNQESVIWGLTLLHFSFMKAKANRAGMEYPSKLLGP